MYNIYNKRYVFIHMSLWFEIYIHDTHYKENIGNEWVYQENLVLIRG